MSSQGNTSGGGADGRLSKNQQAATSLGISAAELKRLRQNIAAAESALQGLTKTERTTKAAARLGLTPSELVDLRRALSGNSSTGGERMSMIVRTALKYSAGSTPPAPGPKGPGSKPKPGPKASAPRRGVPSVFVTKWGQAAHLYYDCANIRGFRRPNEPDPSIYRVETSDPSCRGRKACGTCTNVSPVDGAKVRDSLRKFHGQPFTEAQWSDEGWHRVHPKEPPFIEGG